MARYGSGAPRGFSKYRSWNSRLYPVWDDGDSRYRDCWRGGNVSLEVSNDGPTLTGAKATFTIQLRFPGNQTVLPDGQVVWAQNCTVNGTRFWEGEPVYGNNTSEDWDGVFPDGTPMRTSGRKSKFVFVWKVWGKFWQVADGPSSSLTVVTDSVPLGSYSMEVVVYHSRGRDQFIPMGMATTNFAITELTPSLDDNPALYKWRVQHSILVVVTLNLFAVLYCDRLQLKCNKAHQYLSGSDITFNWDFGDNSGTLISRGLAVTHTYLTAGSFQPLVILQAIIPAAGCVTPGDTPTPGAPTGSAGLVSSEPAPQPLGTTVSSASVAPVVVSTPGPAQTSNPADLDLAVPGSAAAPAAGEDTIALEASVAPADTAVETVAPAEGGDTVAEATASVAPVDAIDTVLPVEAVETVAPDTVALAASVAPVEAVDPINTVTVVEAVADTVAPGVAQASTPVSSVETLESAEGIESVEIVQVQNVETELEALQNAVDLTITCQGSLPSEVCTVISDADCTVPVLTVCNAVQPLPECQLILRQVFNETGVFCVNVSMTNSVSLAMTSTRVNINAASGSSMAATVVLIVGMLLVASAVGAVVFTYSVWLIHGCHGGPDRGDAVIGQCSGGRRLHLQNRAVSFTVRLHDPSQYLSGSDITFNWDFGDNSGTLISRGLAVTHTYLTAGSFQPLVILQAIIPAAGCVTPGDTPTPGAPTGSAGLVSSEPAPQPLGTTVSSASVAPVVVSTTGPAQTSNPADLDLAVPGSAAAPAAGEDTIALEASVAPADTAVETVAPAEGGDTVAETTVSVAPVDAIDTVPPVEAVETVAPDTVALAASVAPVEAVDPINTVTVVEAVADTVAPGVAQASTPASSVEEIIDAVTLESAEGIESVEIVQVQNVETELEALQNAVDLTITCQGSLPSEVCTVISDADCAVPVLTVCNAVQPSPECELILRQVFNETGVFCVNVSMTNSVSLAMTSTRVNINAENRKLAYDCWLEIYKDSSGDMLAGSSLAEEGVEGVVPSSDGLVTGHRPVRLDAMLQAVELPAGIADLGTSLANVDGDALTLWRVQEQS
ncbi:UNVERIFIED_CONTAM: hypothetical protein FKN15_033707 [Acipenser sinensis]